MTSIAPYKHEVFKELDSIRQPVCAATKTSFFIYCSKDVSEDNELTDILQAVHRKYRYPLSRDRSTEHFDRELKKLDD